MGTEEKLESDETSELPGQGDVDSEVSDEVALAEQTPPDEGAGKRTIGLERWVQLGFMVAAILFVWVYDHLITAIWYAFADPNEALATAGAVVLGLITAGILYANKGAYSLVHGVTEELSKVTWPTRKETSSSTLVVVVTSIVAALVLFLFDSVWSAVTDLVYKV
jgi:preprotein translocase subunit SecE